MQMVEFLEDILLHEMELVHPGGVGDLDKKNGLFYAFGKCLGRDPGTNGLKPDVVEAPVHCLERNMMFFQDLLEDVINPLRFGWLISSSHGMI